MKTISTIICFLLLLISANAATAQKEVALPDTAAGKQFKEWLRVFDGGNDQTFKRFISDHYSKSLLTENDADYRADRAARTYLDTQGFRIRDVEKSASQRDRRAGPGATY